MNFGHQLCFLCAPDLERSSRTVSSGPTILTRFSGLLGSLCSSSGRLVCSLGARTRSASVFKCGALAVSAALALGLISPAKAQARPNASVRTAEHLTPPRTAQDDASDNSNQVSSKDIEKYVAVYRAMQRNHAITVDDAASAQGLTVAQFRELENRIERDDAARERARDELQANAASPTPSAGAQATPSN